MKLAPDQAKALDQADYDPMYLGALDAISRGYYIFPLYPIRPDGTCRCGKGDKCPSGPGKHPAIGGWPTEATGDLRRAGEWWGLGGRFRGYGIGAALREHHVIDVDPKNDGQVADWEPRLADTTGVATGQVGGVRGLHLHYLVNQDAQKAAPLPQGAKGLQGWPGVDTRVANKGYVVLPPTRHASGVEYEWTGTATAQVMPKALHEEVVARAGAGKGSRGTSKGTGAPGGARTTLAQVADPDEPTGEGDGRNDKLTKTLGHLLAGNGQRFQDGLRTVAHAINQGYDTPMEEEEVDKIVDSVWSGHEDRHGDEPADGNGWLQVSRGVLHCLVRGKGEDPDHLTPWGNFRLECSGRMRDENDRITYLVRLTMKATGEVAQIALPAAELGDDRVLRKHLSAYGANWHNVPGDRGQGVSPGARLLRFIEAAQPEQIAIVSHLGWHDRARGFVTYDGVLDETGLRPQRDGSRIVADPALAAGGHARYHYGLEQDAAEAVRVLQFVATTQDPSIAAPMMAWWAGSFVKSRLLASRLISLWPILALEGPSGAAKTTGTPALLVELSGSRMGATKPTQAALRNMMASTNAGLVWWDDPNRLDEQAHELLRLSTTQESMAKMAPDNVTVLEFPLRAALVLSGEGLGLDKQLADIDRTILVKMASPQDRTSQIPGRQGRPQWDDIIELRTQYRGETGLTALAGWYVQMALSAFPQLAQTLTAGRRGAGRNNDKQAMMAACARLADAMMAGVGTDVLDRQGLDAAWRGEGWCAQHVDLWQAGDDEGYQRTDYLINRILPVLWRAEGRPESPARDLMDPRRTAIPVFMDRGSIWFNPAAVADAWTNSRYSQGEERIESEGAIISQARAAGLGGSSGDSRKQWRTDNTHGGSGRKVVYWKVSGALAERIIGSSTGRQARVDTGEQLQIGDGE